MFGVRRGALLAVVGAVAGAGSVSAAPVVVLEHWGRFVAAGSDFVSPHDIDTVEIERGDDCPIFPIRRCEVWLLARTTVTVFDIGQRSRKQWADSRSSRRLGLSRKAAT